MASGKSSSKARAPRPGPKPSARRGAAAKPPPDPPDPSGLGMRAVRFIENLTLSNDFRGKPFRLRWWQRAILIRMFGTLKRDGLRQYKDVYLSFGRKQAKTQLSAGIGLYLLLGEGTAGQQIVVAAGSVRQARNLFDKVEEMINADKWLRKQVVFYKSERKIVARRTGNEMFVVSADGALQHGLNPSYILFDELHVQPDGKLYEALTSGQATRKNRLNIFITTAGNRFDSICHAEYQRAKRAQADPAKYPAYLPIIFEASPEDDWHDPEVWRKAMPALGDFCEIDEIQNLHDKAVEDPALESTFKQLYLNMWVASERKWLNRPRWEECGEVEWDPAELAGEECYAGLDLSSNDDFTALVLVFPRDDGAFRVLCWFWLPEERADDRDARDGLNRFREWGRRRFIELTPEDTIDYAWIHSRIKACAKLYQIKKVYIDPFAGTQTALQLRDRLDLDVEFMRQTTVEMNEPVKYLEYLIRKARLHHGDNPVLNWMADNAVSVKDSEGNVKISKGRSADKVDGLVALAMAVAARIREVPDPDCDFARLS